MAIKLTYCCVCKKYKLHTRKVTIEVSCQPQEVEDKGWTVPFETVIKDACIECIGSAKEICRAIKKLNSKEQEAVMAYVLENVGRFKK